MKKLFLFMVFTLFTILMNAQNERKVYCELVGVQKGMFSTKVTVNVDFGQDVKFRHQGNQRLVDENGEIIVFNSMVDAMNYMGTIGWEFEQAYVVTIGQQNVYHWLLSKKITSEEQLKEGIKTELEAKKEKQRDIDED